MINLISQNVTTADENHNENKKKKKEMKLKSVEKKNQWKYTLHEQWATKCKKIDKNQMKWLSFSQKLKAIPNE